MRLSYCIHRAYGKKSSTPAGNEPGTFDLISLFFRYISVIRNLSTNNIWLKYIMIRLMSADICWNCSIRLLYNCEWYLDIPVLWSGGKVDSSPFGRPGFDPHLRSKLFTISWMDVPSRRTSEQRSITMSWLMHTMTFRLTLNRLHKVWWSDFKTMHQNNWKLLWTFWKDPTLNLI